MTEKTKSALLGSFKNAVSTLCGVVLSNLIDPETFIFTTRWMRHVLTVAAVLVAVNEARYWKTWADEPSSGPTVRTTVVLSFFTALFVSILFQFVFRATKF